MSTLLVTSMWHTIFCALANRDFASAPGSQSPEYNILVAICCNCLFFLVSSVLLLALATATPVAPRGHSYCTRASLLLQLCRLMSLRTSQLAGIVRFGTLSNINALIIIVNIIIIIIIIIFIGRKNSMGLLSWNEHIVGHFHVANNILCFGESWLRLGSWIAVPRI